MQMDGSIVNLILLLNVSNQSFLTHDSNTYFDNMGSKWTELFYIAVYSIIFVTGFFGNFIVIYFVLVYKRMQTMTNKFITNLAVSDLLVIFICVPVTASRYMTKEWVFGEFMCRFSSFAQGVSLSVSVMTLTAISIDRYYIIYKPMKARSICTNRKVKIILLSTWILSIFIMSPLLIVFKYEKRKIQKTQYEFFEFSMCFESWPEFEAKLGYEALLICSLFIFPIIFMSYAYINISRTLWSVEQKPQSINKAFVRSFNVINTVALGESSKENREQTAIKSYSGTSIRYKFGNLKLKSLYEKNGSRTSLKSGSLYKKRRYASSKRQSNVKNYQSIKREHQAFNRWKQEGCNDQVHKLECNELAKHHDQDEIEYSLIDASSIENNLNDVEANKYCCARMRCGKKPRKKLSADDLSIHGLDNGKKHTKKPKGDKSNEKKTDNRIIPYSTSQLIKSPRNQLAIHKLIRSRRRVVKLLIILVLLFIVSWLPYHFMSLLIDFIFYWEQYENKSDLSNKQSETISSLFSTHIYPVALCLALANSATNPVCYITLSHGFRNMFKTALKRFIKIR
ncbi:galanin receptor type 1-like [Brachionus plicatilis]|uniref:Galanin receptor type 1-like n=1 Tax=Brachionus plicatilis TaxID=10195 RepID=A0A3M7SQ38_BRAPC|nr:galanin receptor type 1-like [Brachionus plicatilis]